MFREGTCAPASRRRTSPLPKHAEEEGQCLRASRPQLATLKRYDNWKLMDKVSPTEIYQDRNIFLIGSTGFLGKVTLSMLLHSFPNVGRVYVTVRARPQEESEARFWNSVLTAPPFDPLRERYGSALEGFIRDKVVVLGGDIGETNLGYTEEEVQRVADDIDVIINSAGNVTFNPTLESALRTNVVGIQNVIAIA